MTRRLAGRCRGERGLGDGLLAVALAAAGGGSTFTVESAPLPITATRASRGVSPQADRSLGLEEAPKEPGDLLLSHIEMPLTGGHPLVRIRDPLRPPRAGFPPRHRPLPVQPAELVPDAASIATCRA